MKRCNLCILPSSFPNIKFNKDGICNHCLEYNEISYKGKLALGKILEPHKNKVKKYNCIIPLSGGKDSTFVLYYAVKMLNLKPIAINYDSGFQSKLAKENIKNICEILNVPLMIKKANKINKKMLKEALLVSETLGSFFGICGNCEAILRSISINLAKKKNISLILWGATSIENTEDRYINKSNVLGKEGFIRNLRNVKKIFRIFPHIINYYFFSVLQRIQMGIPKKYIFNILNRVPFPKKQIKVIYFYDYIKYDSIKIIQTLKKELKWESPINKKDRFDCLLHSLINHHTLQLLGISSDGYIYSNLVRNGTLRRSEALLKEKHIEKTVDKECRNIINELDLKDYKMPIIKKSYK
jgi:hypothetical protein